MARVTGPLFSMSASGTVGKAVTYGTWKGQPWVRKHFIPENPNTAEQQNVRKAMKLLVSAWQVIPEIDKAPWNTFAEGTGTSGYNQYVKRGMKEYVIQITSAVSPLSVSVVDTPPTETWTWAPVV